MTSKYVNTIMTFKYTAAPCYMFDRLLHSHSLLYIILSENFPKRIAKHVCMNL